MISMLQAAEAESATSKGYVLMMNLLPFVLIFVIFYFLLIRPQKKKQQQHLALLNSIKSGDKVLLSSGIMGSVSRVKDESCLIIEIANNVEIEVVKSSVASVIK